MRFVHFALLAVCVFGVVDAADPEWEGDVSADWGTAGNWNGGVPSSSEQARFLTANVVGTTATLAGPQTVERLLFDHVGVTITGSTLTVAGGTNPDISVLSGTHTISSNVTLGASAATITVAAGANLTISGNLTLGADTTFDIGSGGTLTLSGTVSGAFAVIKTGTGNLVLSGNGTWTGATTVNAGNLQVTGGLAGTSSITVLGVASASIPGTVALLGLTTVDIGTGTTVNVTGAISGAFGLTKTGGGTLALGASNTYTGATTVSAGVLSLTASGALNGTSAVAVSGTGQLELSGNVVLRSVPLTLGSSTVPALRSTSGFNVWPGSIALGAASTIQSDAGTLILGGAITNGGLLLTCDGAGSTIASGVVSGIGGLTKSGGGSLTLAGANTYSGATAIGTGTLVAQHALALGDNGSSNTTTTVSSGAALVLDGTFSVSNRETIDLHGNGGGGGALRSASGSQTLAGPVTMLSASTIAVLNGSSTLTVSGILSGAHLLTAQGGGTLALGNPANSASGGLAVASGTLRLGSATALPSGAISVGGTLDTVTFSPTIAGAFSGSGTVTGTASTVTFTGGGSWSGTFTGSLAVNVTAGTFILNGSATSTHSGNTTVSGTGTLTVNSAATLGSGTSVKIGAGTLALGSVTIAQPIEFTGAGSIATASGAVASLTAAEANLIGAASIGGSGTLSLPTATDFSTLALTGGTLQIGNAGSLGNGVVTISGGTLAPTAAISPGNAITLAGGMALAGTADAVFGTVTINGAPTVTVASGRTHTFNDIRQGTGATLSIAGAGTLRADLTPGAGTAITGLDVQTGATWSTIADASVSLATLTGGGTAQMGSGTLTLTGAPTFAGTIAGTGGLTVNSAGTVTLSGTSTYTGTTTVSAGILSLAGDTGSITFSGSLVVEGGATFAISNAGGAANPNRLRDDLTVTMNGGTFSMTAPTGIDRTETIGVLLFANNAASSISLTAAGAGDCQLTCGDGVAGFVRSGVVATFSLTKANGTSGTANLFSTNGFADGASVAFATGAYTTYKTSVGLDASISVTTTQFAGDWGLAANWDNGVPDLNKTAVVRHAMTSSSSQLLAAKVQFTTGGASPSLTAQGLATDYQLLTMPAGGEIEVLASVSATIAGFSPYGSEGAVILTTQTGSTLTIQGAPVAGQPIDTNIFFRNQLSLRGTGTINLNISNGSIISTWPGLYTGPVAITGGTVNLVHASAIPAMNPANVGMTDQKWALDANAVIDLLGNACRIHALSGGGGRFTNSGAATTLTVTGAAIANGGTLTGSITGSLALTVGNSLTIQGPGACTYSGATNVTGTLAINKPVGVEGIGNSSVVTLNAGAGLTVNGDETIAGLSVAGGNTVTVASGATLSATGATAFIGGLTLAGGGTFALSPSSDSSGSGVVTVVGSSTVRIARALHLGSAASIVLNPGTLAVQGALGALTLPQAINLTDAGTLDVASGTTLTSAAINGPGALTKLGAGTLVMGSTTCTQASTAVLAGTLEISDYRHLGASDLTLDGGTLHVTTGLSATTGPSGTGSTRALTIGSGGGTASVAASQTLTWPGLVSGAGSLGKTGTGTLVLAAANAGFTGPFAISAGVVRIDDAGALGGSASGTQVADGASLLVNGAFALTEPLTLVGDGGSVGAMQLAAGASVGTGVMQLSPGATKPATVAVASGSATISSRLRGSGGIVKIGAGTLVLSDLTSDFTGTVVIAAGTVQVADEASFGAGGNAVALNGGTLAVSAPVSFNASRVLQVTLAGGTVSTGASTLTVPGLDTSAGQNLQLVGAGGLVVNTSVGINSTIGGSLFGTGSLTKAGSGTLSLLSANDGIGANPSYTGAISVNAGQFRINGSVAAASTCTIAAPAVLSGSGTLGVAIVNGTVRPGGVSAAGVLSAASLAVGTTAVLDFDLGTANDLLAVAGAVTVANGSDLHVAGLPNAAAFGAGDYSIISAGASWTYTAGDMAVTYDAGIPGGTSANYRLIDGGTSMILQRNRAPEIVTGVVTTPGTTSTSTTPPAYVVGPPGSTVLFSALVGSGPSNKLVQAVDPEGVATAAQLVFSIELDPSQGRIERYNGTVWQQVSSDTLVSPISSWTQADIDAGNVRYISTGAVGGNDAILYSCVDNLGAESPLYLMRFTIQGSGPPVISGLPATATWSEQATKPGPWAALAPAATLAASNDPLDGGLFKATLLNGESGDELGFVGNGVEVAANGTVSLSGVPIGSLVATTTSLTVTLNANASQARVTALLQATSFRTSNQAPVAVGRSIELRANDGSVAGGTTISAFPLTIDLYNDAPTLSLTVDVNGTAYAATAMPGIPNLLRTGKVTPSDPEGEPAVNVTMTLFQGALQGTLVFNSNGTFSYRPNFLPGGLATDVLEDSFIVTVTDRDFSVSPSATRVDGVGAASRYDAASRQVTVPIRIAAGGAGLAFLNVPRMTVDNLTGGSFSYTPQLQLPSGAGTVRFELIDVPGAVTLGTGAGQLNFSPSTGVISWPAVPPPAGTLPQYWRFGILATDPTTGSAALLPVMLRVGTGGTNG
jgi:fibronectin-binding autotransporter adhesin